MRTKYLFPFLLTISSIKTKEESLPPTELKNLNSDPNCIQYYQGNPGKCVECIDNWGPWPIDFKNSVCRKCNISISNCFKCQWNLDIVGTEKVRTYKCMNCTFGYHPFNTTQIISPFHFGSRCVRCPPNCIDCLSNKYCTLCPNDREIYLPPNAYFFEPYRYCRYYFEYKMMYLGIFSFFVVSIGIWLANYFCVNVSMIKRTFLVSNESSRNFVEIGNLMAAQNVYVPGGKKTGRSSGSYTPKMSSYKSSRLLSVRTGVKAKKEKQF